MRRSIYLKLFVFLSTLALPQALQAQAAKPLLDSKIVFAPDGQAKVSYNDYGSKAEALESSKIESTLIFYALTMNKVDLDTGKALMGQVQGAVSKIATEQGMVRADIVKANPMLKPVQGAPAEQSVTLAFAELAGKGGHSLELKPDNLDVKYLAPATLYLIQDQVKNLSESGLRLLVLSMGGMNKWYREIGKASDPESVGKAPSYALNLAVDILQKLSGGKAQ
ncbi:MAG TPA: hypothetical protein VFW62_01910, partial [bacterium]|nr:hypothetical protein [bacterium]